VLAAKTALAIRVDAMGETTDTSVGIENRSKVEARLRQLEGGELKGGEGDGPAGVLRF
jgi:nucleolar protein 58